MATLQEAIASGRPFKRKDWKNWRTIRDGMVLESDDGNSIDLAVCHIVATDWEIKPDPRKWEFNATTSWRGLEFTKSPPSEFIESIKVKVTIEEIIE